MLSDQKVNWKTVIQRAEKTNALLSELAASASWDEFYRTLETRDQHLALLAREPLESLPENESLELSERVSRLAEQNQALVALAEAQKQNLQHNHQQTVKGRKAVKAYKKSNT
ncbi:flagellar protein FliT [Gilvimarinus chinensis]|uniref:flagellar protein FliT n=1 Tax=Gilvimarinus chinensis TaxID=396005 RepID=UPI0003670E06|nr:flagellar protein FliT [Gilvimarinus chinensis]